MKGGETMAGMNVERDIWNHLMEVMDRLEKVETEAKEQHRRDTIRIKELETKVADLEKRNAILQDEIDRLKHKDDTDSHNSSLPPSTDQKPAKAPNEYNGRKKTGRTSGGQKGHPGKTLRIRDCIEKLKAAGVEPKVEEIGDIRKPYKERLIIDILLKPSAILNRFHAQEDGKCRIPEEYNSEVVYGTNIKAMTALLYGQGVQSAERIVELIKAISGDCIEISQGTVFNWLEALCRNAKSEEAKIEGHLLDQTQVCTDATTASVDGHQVYIRNFSDEQWVFYVPMERKNIETLAKIPFMRKFAGTLTHDHETALYHFGADHAECNVHLIRYLTANTENTGHMWSRKLIALLCEANRYRKRMIAEGKSAILQGTLSRLDARYDELLDFAKHECKQHPAHHRWATIEETSLLNRLKKYKRNHLLFLRDFDVPFDNNMSERDLRKCKNRQKMTGGFRSSHGLGIFCTLLSVTETCKRQAINLMNAFRNLINHNPIFT